MVCSKRIETEAVFTKTETNNKLNVNFLQNTRCVQKESKLKLCLPSQKLAINKTLIFFKIFSLIFSTPVPVSFLMDEVFLKDLFLYWVKLYQCILQ